jgi:hypothetical protein
MFSSFPKLSSIIIKKNEGMSGIKLGEVAGLNSSGFMHILLAIQLHLNLGIRVMSLNTQG